MKGKNGGAEAADCLFDQVNDSIQRWSHANDWIIVARVYANVAGLLRKSRSQLEPLVDWEVTDFAQGFSQQRPHFDFIDTGSDISVVSKLEGEWFPAYVDWSC